MLSALSNRLGGVRYYSQSGLGSLSRTTLMGWLGRNPERIGHGIRMVVATNSSYFNEGQWESSTEWHNVFVAKGDSFNNWFMSKAGKGAHVYVEGSNQTRKFEDRNGVERSRTVVHVGKAGKLDLLAEGRHGSAEDPSEGPPPEYHGEGHDEDDGDDSPKFTGVPF